MSGAPTVTETAKRALNVEAWSGPDLGFRPALEGLRGVAVLMVVLFHGGWLPGGFLGVDVFLVLSGFLITTLLLEEFRATDRISLRDFFVRRGLRLYPALALYLLAFVGVTLVFRYGDVGAQLRSAGYAAVYLSNVPLAYAQPPWFASELTHLWTLAAEAQFYLVWPPILVLLLKASVRLRTIGVGLLVVAGGVALARAGIFASGAPWARTYYGPELRFDTILVGCALAMLFVSGAWRAPKRWAVAVAAAGLAGAFVVVHIESSGVLFLGGLVFVALLSAVLVGAATSTQPTWFTRLLSTKILMEFGRVSYSWYLWHVLWLSLVNFTLGPHAEFAKIAAIVASFGCAEMSYRLVEVRFLRLKSRFTVGRATVDPLA